MRKYKSFKDEFCDTALLSGIIIVGVFTIFGLLYGAIMLFSDMLNATVVGKFVIAIVVGWFVSTTLSLALSRWLRRRIWSDA